MCVLHSLIQISLGCTLKREHLIPVLQIQTPLPVPTFKASLMKSDGTRSGCSDQQWLWERVSLKKRV